MYKNSLVDVDILVTLYHDQQDRVTGDDLNQYISNGTNFQETINMGAIFELDGNYYKVLE